MTVQNHLDLVFDDGVPIQNDQHSIMANFYLREPLQTWLAEQGRKAFIGSNSSVYYDPAAPPVGPDFYVVLDGQRKKQKGWVVWDENGLKPNLVIEMLSPSTEAEDRGRKFCIYRDDLRVADYFLVNSDTQRLEGFHLIDEDYRPVAPDAAGRLPSSSLPLSLRVHEGNLRLFTDDGVVLPTANERSEAEHARAEAERARADEAFRRAESAEGRLHELEERLRRLEGGEPR